MATNQLSMDATAPTAGIINPSTSATTAAISIPQFQPRRESRTSESSDEGYHMSPAAARRFARRNQRPSSTPDLVTSLVRPPSPDTFYTTGQAHRNGARQVGRLGRIRPQLSGQRVASSCVGGRRSGPSIPPHPSSLDIPKKYGGASIFDLYSLTYVSECDPNLLCPICHDPLVDPVTTPCDHTFCYRCLRRSIESSPAGTVCPIDRDTLSWSDCFSAARLIRTQLCSMIVQCPYRNRGCNKDMKRDLVESHALNDCRFKDYICPDANCDKKARQKPVDDLCSHKEISCKYCDETIQEQDREHHLVSCAQAKTRCEECWQLVLRSSMESHHQLDCDGIQVGCTYQDLGCPIRMERGHLTEHLAGCAFHPDTASGMVIRSQHEIIRTYTDLSSQIQEMHTRQDETARRMDEMASPSTSTSTRAQRGGSDTTFTDHNRTIQDVDAGFEEVHQNLTHLEARQSMWTLNQVMPIREEVTELRNNINMIRMHVNWLLNRSREEGRIRAAANTGGTSVRREEGEHHVGPVWPERRRSSGSDVDLPRL